MWRSPTPVSTRLFLVKWRGGLEFKFSFCCRLLNLLPTRRGSLQNRLVPPVCVWNQFYPELMAVSLFLCLACHFPVHFLSFFCLSKKKKTFSFPVFFPLFSPSIFL